LIESGLGLDLRGKIAATVVSGGYELLELRAISLSLEDVFLQLTTEEKTAEEKTIEEKIVEEKIVEEKIVEEKTA
jgi:ABC-2 type transport system ATP-binding protein